MRFNNNDTVLDTKFSVVIPCFNEAKTLEKSVERVRAIGDDNLKLEVSENWR